MKTEPIKVTHNGIEIFYSEDQNMFIFELRGRERKVDSLRAAREAIDKPEPTPKKPFERIDVFFKKWSEWRNGQVTCFAESGYGGPSVWVVAGKERSKEYASSVYPSTEKNLEVLKKIKEAEAEMASLSDKISRLTESLKPVELPKDE